jgi:O-antigen/teichoic acid export membrane protein
MNKLFDMLPFMRAWRTKSLQIASSPEAPRQMADVFGKFVFAMLVVAVFLAACIRDVITLLTPPGFWPAIPLARVEIATAVLAGGSSFMTFGLLYAGKTADISRIKIVVSVIKVLFSLALISYFGLLGAAASALIMEAVTFAWLCRRSQREYYVPVSWRRIAALCAVAAGCVALAVHISRPGGIMAEFVSAVLVSPLILLVSALVPDGSLSLAVREALTTRQESVTGLLVSGVVASTFLLSAPLVHADWWRRLRSWPLEQLRRNR